MYQDDMRVVTLVSSNVSGDTVWLMLDKSDSTNYPFNSSVTSFNLFGLDVSAEKNSDGAFMLYLGVVLENDGTDGTAQWVEAIPMEAVGNAVDSTDRFSGYFDYTCMGLNRKGIRTEVVSGATTHITGASSGNLTALQNDAGNLESAAGGSSLSAAVGDVVVYADETSGTGNIKRLSLKLFYNENE